MVQKRYLIRWLAGAAVLLAACAAPASAQYKVGQSLNVTVYESPT
jgi:outer membrane biogenesis lipoprotein LolB